MSGSLILFAVDMLIEQLYSIIAMTFLEDIRNKLSANSMEITCLLASSFFLCSETDRNR